MKGGSRLIIVCPQHDAESLCASRAPSHVISLSSPGATLAPPPSARHRLSLCFHDIAAERDGLVLPDAAAMRAILDFGRSWGGDAPLLIHCWAGISRSCAAAYVLACDAMPGCERELADELRRRAPFATPNPLMVRIADDILARGGRMMAAIASIGRGAEAPHGMPFEIPVAPV